MRTGVRLMSFENTQVTLINASRFYSSLNIHFNNSLHCLDVACTVALTSSDGRIEHRMANLHIVSGVKVRHDQCIADAVYSIERDANHTRAHTHTRARVHRPTYHQSLTLTGRTSLDQSQADVDGLENTLFNAHLDFDLPVTYKTQMRPLAGRLTTHRAAGPAGK